MRKQRKVDLASHLDLKPGENDDDERDNTAIKLAEDTVGDYKLKVADNYEILEEYRVNASKKKSQVGPNICDLFLYSTLFTFLINLDREKFSLLHFFFFFLFKPFIITFCITQYKHL
jgi:hypothetical protein